MIYALLLLLNPILNIWSTYKKQFHLLVQEFQSEFFIGFLFRRDSHGGSHVGGKRVQVWWGEFGAVGGVFGTDLDVIDGLGDVAEVAVRVGLHSYFVKVLVESDTAGLSVKSDSSSGSVGRKELENVTGWGWRDRMLESFPVRE